MAQEWVSIALVRALCAQAGLNVSSWDWDDGLDLTVGSAKGNYAGVKPRNVKFHLQLKSTTTWVERDGKISFWLKAEKYNQLAAESWDPQHLVLYTLPRDRWRWIQSRRDHAALNHCAYFFSFNGLKTLSETVTGSTIQIPVANRLTASELVRMYRDAGARTLNHR